MLRKTDNDVQSFEHPPIFLFLIGVRESPQESEKSLSRKCAGHGSAAGQANGWTQLHTTAGPTRNRAATAPGCSGKCRPNRELFGVVCCSVGIAIADSDSAPPYQPLQATRSARAVPPLGSTEHHNDEILPQKTPRPKLPEKTTLV